MKFLSLSLLIFLSSRQLRAAAAEDSQQWPYNLPPDTKYFPEDEAIVHKYASIQKRLSQERPQSIRKMKPDDGQMFFLDYWGFADHKPVSNFSAQAHSIQPAMLPIFSEDHIQARFIPRVITKRDFQCPSDTTSCSNIGRSDTCCPSGLTCNIISNSGSVAVGCCQGSLCTGQISSCPADYTSCDAVGGGCCVPGFACASGGCIKTATETIVVTPTHSSTPSPTSATSSTPTTTSPPPTTSSTSTTSTSASTCSSGYNSCAASLGGGCCPTSMVCGPSTSCLSPSTSSRSSSTTSSNAIIPPARPTSIETSLTSIPATITGTRCPTGFYQCSAYYNAGSCCQVGRDCGMTSCPPSNPSTALQSDGVTVVVGNGGTAATAAANDAGGQKGACATGWFSCAASVGGDCCPTGLSCGTASCYMNGTSGAVETGKKDPEKNEGAGGRIDDVGNGVLRAFGAIIGTIGMGLLL